MTAGEIMDRLAERHWKDVFVSECKDGPTWTNMHLRMDAWAMTKSWSNFRTFGYEVKVTRSDFLHDQKMASYMPLCHEFYIVAPAEVVKSYDELPEGAGFILASQTSRRLLAKKKAQYREIPDPVLVYRYVLMSRAKIIRPYADVQTPEERERFWRGWLERREINHELGQHVSKALSVLIEKRITDVDRENKNLIEKNAEYEEVKALLRQLGISSPGGWGIREKLETYKAGFPDEMKQALRRAKNSMDSLTREIDEIEAALSRK